MPAKITLRNGHELSVEQTYDEVVRRITTGGSKAGDVVELTLDHDYSDRAERKLFIRVDEIASVLDNPRRPRI